MTHANHHIAEVCQIHAISKADLLGPSKCIVWAKPRKELFHRLLIRRGLSLYQAAKHGKKHHTTGLKCARQYSAAQYGTSMKASLEEMRQAYLASLQTERVAA